MVLPQHGQSSTHTAGGPLTFQHVVPRDQLESVSRLAQHDSFGAHQGGTLRPTDGHERSVVVRLHETGPNLAEAARLQPTANNNNNYTNNNDDKNNDDNNNNDDDDNNNDDDDSPQSG